MKLRRFIGLKVILISEPDEPEGKHRTVLAGEDIVALARDPRDAHRMLAGSYGRGLFKSSDGGANWMVELFVIDPYQPDTIFAICSEGTLLHSDIHDVNWQVVQDNVAVECLEFIEQN